MTKEARQRELARLAATKARIDECMPRRKILEPCVGTGKTFISRERFHKLLDRKVPG